MVYFFFFLIRLKSDLERVCVDQEERAQQQALRHSHEMAAFKEQLAEAESVKNSLQNEASIQNSPIYLIDQIKVLVEIFWN